MENNVGQTDKNSGEPIPEPPSELPPNNSIDPSKNVSTEPGPSPDESQRKQVPFNFPFKLP